MRKTQQAPKSRHDDVKTVPVSDATIIRVDHDTVTTLGEFLAANQDGIGPKEADEIRNSLNMLWHYHGGGGAAAAFHLERLYNATETTVPPGAEFPAAKTVAPVIGDRAEAAQAIRAFIQKNEDLLVHLRYRWLDESEYEDIEQYGDRIKKEFPDNWKLRKMFKRPFGFEVKVGDKNIYRISVKAGCIEWKKIG